MWNDALFNYTSHADLHQSICRQTGYSCWQDTKTLYISTENGKRLLIDILQLPVIICLYEMCGKFKQQRGHYIVKDRIFPES